MKLIPLADRVVLKKMEAEETTKSGFILGGSAKEKRDPYANAKGDAAAAFLPVFDNLQGAMTAPCADAVTVRYALRMVTCTCLSSHARVDSSGALQTFLQLV